MRLTKTEIGTVNTKVLNYRYCYLLKKGERIPAHEFSIAELREVLWIEDELHERVIRAVGHDFYPSKRIVKEKALKCNLSVERKGPYAKPRPAPQGKRHEAPREAEKPKLAPANKIKFKVILISSIGTKVADFTVEAESKAEAGVLAAEEIRKLGLRKATYKIK